MDKKTVDVVDKIQETLPEVNLSQTQAVEKIEGNLTNTFIFVVGGDTIEEPKEQITVIQNKETGNVKVIDFEEVPSQVFVKPIRRPVSVVPDNQLHSKEITTIVKQLQQTIPNITGDNVVVKGATTEETKFVKKYTLTV